MSRTIHTLTEAREVMSEHSAIIKAALRKAGFSTKIDRGYKDMEDGHISFPNIDVFPKGEDSGWIRGDMYCGLYFNDDHSDDLTLMAISSGNETSLNINEVDDIVTAVKKFFATKDCVDYFAIPDKDDRWDIYGG